MLSGCKSGVDTYCSRIHEVNISSECYDKTKGLVATAVDAPENVLLEWMTMPMKIDSTTGGIRSEVDDQYQQNSYSGSITIPDSVIKDNTILKIGFACRHSHFFIYKMRVSADATCTTWQLTERGKEIED